MPVTFAGGMSYPTSPIKFKGGRIYQKTGSGGYRIVSSSGSTGGGYGSSGSTGGGYGSRSDAEKRRRDAARRRRKRAAEQRRAAEKAAREQAEYEARVLKGRTKRDRPLYPQQPDALKFYRDWIGAAKARNVLAPGTIDVDRIRRDNNNILNKIGRWAIDTFDIRTGSLGAPGGMSPEQKRALRDRMYGERVARSSMGRVRSKMTYQDTMDYLLSGMEGYGDVTLPAPIEEGYSGGGGGGYGYGGWGGWGGGGGGTTYKAAPRWMRDLAIWSI